MLQTVSSDSAGAVAFAAHKLRKTLGSASGKAVIPATELERFLEAVEYLCSTLANDLKAIDSGT